MGHRKGSAPDGGAAVTIDSVPSLRTAKTCESYLVSNESPEVCRAGQRGQEFPGQWIHPLAAAAGKLFGAVAVSLRCRTAIARSHFFMRVMPREVPFQVHAPRAINLEQ